MYRPGTRAVWLGSGHLCHRLAAVSDPFLPPPRGGLGVSKPPVTLVRVGQALCVPCSPTVF